MKQIILSLFLAFFSLISIAQERAEYDGIDAIKEIKEGWLIVRLPGFEQKIAALDSLLSNPSLSEKARDRLDRELTATVEEKTIIHELYPAFFDSVYSFSKVAFIYTHESTGFQAGKIPARSAKGVPIDSVYLQNYFFATLHGGVGDPFKFTTKDHRLLSYPFPNNIAKPGALAYVLLPPAWAVWMVSFTVDESSAWRAYKHVVRVERKLDKMHQRYF